MWKNLMILLVLMELNCSEYSEYAPEIQKSQTKYVARLNETVCLKCKLKVQYTDNNKKILFYWRKDGTLIKTSSLERFTLLENNCLQIKNVRSSDHGNYTCYAMNSVGQVQSMRILTVVNRDMNIGKSRPAQNDSKSVTSVVTYPTPPFFQDFIKVKSSVRYKKVRVGAKAKFRCAVEGSPSPEVKWYYNGHYIQASDGVIIRSKKKKKLLIIETFTESDVGNYTCIGKNVKGTAGMTFIVSLYEPFVYPKQEFNWVVRTGDNVTLPCELPADKVTYIYWKTPSRQVNNHNDLQKDVNRSTQDRHMYLHDTVNGTIMKNYILYNASEKMHAGIYICQVFFTENVEPSDVKVYRILFERDNKLIPIGGEREPVNMVTVTAISVSVGVFVIIIAITCVRCRQKQAKHLSKANESKNMDDQFDGEDEETMSLKILPEYPTGSLTIHRKSTEDSNDNIYTTRTNCVDYTELGRLETKVVQYSPPEDTELTSQQNVSSFSKRLNSSYSNNSDNTVTENNRQTSSSDTITRSFTKNPWPGEKLLLGDPDYIGFYEDDTLFSRSSSCNRLSKKRSDVDVHKKRKHRPEDTRSTRSAVTHSGGVLDDDIPPLIISDSPPEEEDKLLKREMKMWEPLIKTSARTNNDADATTQLLSSRFCDDVSHVNSHRTNHLIL